MVSSLCRAHLLTLTLVLVFFPLHIYMESVVCLCSVLWGVSVSLFGRDIKQGQRGTWWLEHDRDVYFLPSYIVTNLGSHFSCFLLMGKLHHKTEKTKTAQMSSLSSEKCCRMFSLSVQMMLKVLSVCTKNTPFLAHHTYVFSKFNKWSIFGYLGKINSLLFPSQIPWCFVLKLVLLWSGGADGEFSALLSSICVFYRMLLVFHKQFPNWYRDTNQKPPCCSVAVL